MSMTENSNEPISIDEDKEYVSPSHNFTDMDQNILITLAREENEYNDEKHAHACYRLCAGIVDWVLWLVPLIQPFAVSLFSILQFYYLVRQGTDIQSDVNKIFIFCFLMSLYCFLMGIAAEKLNAVELDKRYFSRIIILKHKRGIVVPTLQFMISLILIFVVVASFKSSIFESFWKQFYSFNT